MSSPQASCAGWSGLLRSSVWSRLSPLSVPVPGGRHVDSLPPVAPAALCPRGGYRGTERQSLPAELDGQSIRGGESLCAERDQ